MRCGYQTYLLDNSICILETFSLVGPYEAKGSFREFYDATMDNDEWECKSHELAEIKMQNYVSEKLINKANLSRFEIDCYLGGDLINQITASSFSCRDLSIPFMGLYNACATFGESLIIGSMLLESQLDRVLCITSSHYATAERQYRYPLELGTQPTPESQWTVTGCGGLILEKSANKSLRIKSVTIGKIIDLDCTDANNMGMAMAPAAADTIVTHLKELNRKPTYYDLIITGDLGRLGRDTCHYLCKEKGYDLTCNLNDCGALIYSKEQKRGQGGSGAGCSSSVFCSYLYKNMISGNFKKVLFVPTGALLSKDSPLQGDSIPAIAHAIDIEVE